MPNIKSSIDMFGRLIMSVPQFFNPIEFRIIRTTPEFNSASRLVYDAYLKRSYIQPNNSQMKLTVYQTLPTTTTFIALHRWHGVLATITLVEDSPLGLPMDDAYKLELDTLRRKGLRLAEPTMLALNSNLFGRGVFTMFHAKKLMLTLRLFKVMFDYLRSNTQADELVACFNPKHKVLYDFLHLKPLGGNKVYAGANGHPAIAQRLNLKQHKKESSKAIHKFFYRKAVSTKQFAKKHVMSQDDLRNLFVIQSPIFSSASPTELAFIQNSYPNYDFKTILSPTAHIQV